MTDGLETKSGLLMAQVEARMREGYITHMQRTMEEKYPGETMTIAEHVASTIQHSNELLDEMATILAMGWEAYETAHAAVHSMDVPDEIKSAILARVSVQIGRPHNIVMLLKTAMVCQQLAGLMIDNASEQGMGSGEEFMQMFEASMEAHDGDPFGAHKTPPEEMEGPCIL